jgi:hypothetical protein
MPALLLKKSVMKKIFLITFVAAMIGCTKAQLEQPRVQQCDRACALSYKYTIDTVLIKIDTLWKDDHLCGRWLDSIKVRMGNDQWTVWRPGQCPPPVPSMPNFRLECLKYKVGK